MKTADKLGAWIAIGAGVGAALGVALDNMPWWLAIGIASGALVGGMCSLRSP